VFIIGIDPHKASPRQRRSTATSSSSASCPCALIATNRPVVALGDGVRAAAVGSRRCDECRGLVGATIVGVGETVVDVPPALSAASACVGRRSQGQDRRARRPVTRAAAIVALRHRHLQPVVLEDHRQVLRFLARRHHQLVAGLTRAICRLHAVLCEMIEGGLAKKSVPKTCRFGAPKAPSDWGS